MLPKTRQKVPRYPAPIARYPPPRKGKSFKDEEEEKVPTRTVRIEKQVRTTGSNNDFAFDDPAIIEIGDELLP